MTNLTKDEVDNGIRHTIAGGWRMTDERYHAWWLRRVKRRVIVDANGCWLWQGQKHPKGYGQTAYRSHTINLHRAMWMVMHGGVKLSEDQLVCHKCDVRNCCNPEHLFLGTAKDNNRDCGNKGRHHNGVKTHCKHGHPFTPENTYLAITATTVMRHCKECARIRMRNEWQNNPEKRERQRLRRRAKRLAQEKRA